MPCDLFFREFKPAVCQPAKPPKCSPAAPNLHAPAELLHLHAPAICFSGGSRLPFAPASNPPNASAGLQGNNSYSYMPLPSVFQGVQDCRLTGLKPSKRFRRPQGNNSYSYMPLPSVFQGVQDCRLTGLKPSKRFRRPPRQQLLQLHALRSVFPGVQACRLPARKTPQTLRSVFQGVQACRLPARKTPQMLPCSSQSTCSCRTLTPTCPCHLFFRGFKTAVCPASNPPNASAGLQGNNSYSYMPFSGSSRLPFDRPETFQTLPQASKATTLTATCPCHLFFREFKTAV